MSDKLNIKKTKISLEELTKLIKIEDYIELANIIKRKIELNELEPIISSKTNGKKPALYNRYWSISKEKNKTSWEEELNFKIHPKLNIDYYRNNPNSYKKDRDNILKISNYLYNHKPEEEPPCSINERSFEIFFWEKYLQKEGRQLLKNLSFSIESLNIYNTGEPLAYYSHHKDTPQNILIIENKDTFYSLRRHLLSKQNKILGVPIGTIIYGKGKAIIKTFADLELCGEPYIADNKNTFLYFGDIDYEGIGIYESFYKRFNKDFNIKPFKEGYQHMLEKAKGYELPKTKEGQQEGNYIEFYKEFPPFHKEEIETMLKKRKYIPQEILKISDI